MTKSLSFHLRRTIISWRTLITSLVGLLMLIWYSIANWMQVNRFLGEVSYGKVCGDFLTALYEAHARTGFSLFAPIFAVIPSVTLFCDEYNSGYIKSILLRSDTKKYIRERIIISSIAGGLSVFLPEFICSFVFVIAGRPHQPSQYSSFLDGTIFDTFQYIGNGLIVLAFFMFFAFLFGSVWANIGMCISAYIPNRYVALAAPFAMYYGIHLLLNRSTYFAMYSPANMLQPTSPLLGNILFPIAYQLLLLTLSITLFGHKVERRIENV